MDDRQWLRWAPWAAAGLVALAPFVAQGQTAPRADEVARFPALHAAAHRGDLAALRQALAAGADVDGRDGHGRTPLHVATFARQYKAVQALLQFGADPAALEQGRYDAVTIAAVIDATATRRSGLAGC